MDKIKFAILGCGHIGKRHAEMIRRNEETELVAMIDSNEKLKSDLESAFNASFFPSLGEYLKSGVKCDVVNIATPNGLHAEQALQAIETGHHVVIEKPMGLSKKDCENVIYKALHHSKH